MVCAEAELAARSATRGTMVNFIILIRKAICYEGGFLNDCFAEYPDFVIVFAMFLRRRTMNDLRVVALIGLDFPA